MMELPHSFDIQTLKPVPTFQELVAAHERWSPTAFGVIPADQETTDKIKSDDELQNMAQEICLRQAQEGWHSPPSESLLLLIDNFRLDVGAAYLHYAKGIQSDIETVYKATDRYMVGLWHSLFNRTLRPFKYRERCGRRSEGLLGFMMTVAMLGDYEHISRHWGEKQIGQNKQLVIGRIQHLMGLEREYRSATISMIGTGMGVWGMTLGIVGLLIGLVGLILAVVALKH